MTSAAYQTISLWFKTSGPDGVLFGSSAQDGAPTGTTTQSFSPELYIGSDGKLVGGVPGRQHAHGDVLGGRGRQRAVAQRGAGRLRQRPAAVPRRRADRDAVGRVRQPRAEPTTSSATATWAAAGPTSRPTTRAAAPGTAYGFDGDISDVAVWARQLTPAEVQSLYAAATHPAALLTKLTQPSGSVYAQVGYDPLTGRVTSDTDSNGGTWQVGMPGTQGSSQAWVSSVLGAQPVRYYRLNDTGATQASDLAYHCACSSPAYVQQRVRRACRRAVR